MRLSGGSEPECTLAIVPTCRWNDVCTQTLIRDGCSTCAFTRGSRDKDNDPLPSVRSDSDTNGSPDTNATNSKGKSTINDIVWSSRLDNGYIVTVTRIQQRPGKLTVTENGRVVHHMSLRLGSSTIFGPRFGEIYR